VTCLWLLPFFPTPNRDNGYDIVDYDGIDPRLGSLDDFLAFRRAAAERGLRLVLDLVVHHTSDQHPWFQAARSDPASPYRDYYVWCAEPPAESAAKLIFPGVEESVWSYDSTAGASYLHQFYAFEPDLNVQNSAVQEEIKRVMALWRDRGADGFRVDAASHMLGTEALVARPPTQPHATLRRLRSFLDGHQPGGALLAEADVAPDHLADYFGAGDEMHLLLNFYLDNFLFLAFARQEAEPIARALRHLPQPAADGQWANFLRNLDELDLEQLSGAEREEVYRAFAPEERMRSYGRGIRRRLAPMLGGDPRRLRLAFSLLLTLPGTPIMIYGDELGLGDDLSLPEREGVRPAMTWSAEANGGFTAASPRVPVLTGGPFGFRRVNVADQTNDPDSLLCWLRRAIATRRQYRAFGRGSGHVIESDDRRLLCHRCDCETDRVVVVHNLSAEPATVELRRDGDEGALAEVFADRDYPPPDGARPRVEVAGFGYRWFRLENFATWSGSPL
jgi:maltose alpha-D-glucosyltransferase/alpha-amylase